MGGIYAESLRGPRHADGSFNLTQGGTHRFARGFAQAAMPPARRGGDSASGRVGRGDVGERVPHERGGGRTAVHHRSRCLASTALPTSEYIRMTMHTYTGLTPMLFRAFLGCASHRATRTAIQVLFFPKKTQIG
jgi:hypothetical protein